MVKVARKNSILIQQLHEGQEKRRFEEYVIHHFAENLNNAACLLLHECITLNLCNGII